MRVPTGCLWPYFWLARSCHPYRGKSTHRTSVSGKSGDAQWVRDAPISGSGMGPFLVVIGILCASRHEVTDPGALNAKAKNAATPRKPNATRLFHASFSFRNRMAKAIKTTIVITS